MTAYDDGLDERDDTPPEYEGFKEWFDGRYPDRTAVPFQDLYRAYQAGYHADRECPPGAQLEAG